MATFATYFVVMDSFRYILACVALLIADKCYAQFTAVVLDLETRRQIAGVSVHINPRGLVKTDARGRFAIDGPFNSVTIGRQGYESLALDSVELSDTIWLLPNGRSLDEVVIIGHRPKRNFNLGPKRKAWEQKSTKTGVLKELNFFDLFRFKENKHRKRRKKIKEVLDNY